MFAQIVQSRGGNVGFRSELGQRRKGNRLRMAKHEITDFTKPLRHAGMLLLNLRHKLIEGLGFAVTKAASIFNLLP